MRVMRHKADAYGEDDMDFIVKRCWSDRPAFCIVPIDVPAVEDVAVEQKPLLKIF